MMKSGCCWVKYLEEYDPIVFRKGKFYVSNAAYASFPVLRVTANGANAYTRFYNRRLPTYEEWLYAVVKGKKTEVKSEHDDMSSNDTMDMEKMHSRMLESRNEADGSQDESMQKHLSPVSAFKVNKFGIRAMEKGFSEWSLQGASALSEEPSNDTSYMVMPTGVARQPWEAFDEVGFRSAQNVERRFLKSK